MRMDRRDFNYIEHRLAVPCGAAVEAHERLKLLDLTKEADELMVAMQTFVRACRKIRAEL
jgi:hypothetical protein